MAQLEYKCPSCGGAIAFDSNIQKMKCPFCECEFDMETVESFNNENADSMVWETQAGSEWQEGETEGMRVYTCKSCGGEIIGDANTAATSCPYCGNPVVFSGQFSGDLRPDYVIPFKLDKAAAKAGLMKHLEGKRLLPKIFRDQNHIDEIKGIYVPFWLFDADAFADVKYKASKSRVWSDNYFNYTEIQYFSVFRSGSLGFVNVPVDGSVKMEDELMESIEPYNFKDAVEFESAYLAGYLADKYDVPVEEGMQRANERIRKSIEEMLRNTVNGYNTVDTENSRVQLANGVAKYALYPVWMLTTSWQDKKYTFAMNGQTGKFVGDLPLDKGAYWLWFFGLFLGIGAAAAALLYFFLCGEWGILGGALLGLLISLIVTGGMKSKLKDVKRQKAATSYIRANSFVVTNNREMFLYKNVEKTAKAQQQNLNQN